MRLLYNVYNSIVRIATVGYTLLLGHLIYTILKPIHSIEYISKYILAIPKHRYIILREQKPFLLLERAYVI
jgi:hypothetical protein